jgi:transposase
MFATSFWVRLLMEKFLFQRPLHRVRKVLALEGLCVSQGTLTGGLRRIGELLQPVYTRILERSRTANHWKMDETRWLVFEEVEGKEGYRWWLWVVITDDTVVFLLEPTRSAQVPRDHLGENPEGIINADRYSVYKALGNKIRVAFCWSHVRRDFVRIHDGYPRLRNWGESWITRINELFKLNDERLEVLSDPQAFQEKDRALRDAIDTMAKQRDRELEYPSLGKPARKALESLRNHWEGCILFVDHPEIPMDNNESETGLRAGCATRP